MIRLIIFFFIIIILSLYELKKNKYEKFSNNNKKIAIVSTFNYHFECVGFLCELFKNYDVDLYHVSEINNENYIGYFKSIYKNLNNYNINLFKKKQQDYFKIVKLSSYDNIDINKNKKDAMISIVHYKKSDEIINNNKNIIISPLVKLNKPSIYILPVFMGKKLNTSINTNKNKTIIFIGRNFHNNIDDFIKFVKKINYKIVIFTRKNSFDSAKKLHLLTKEPNIEFNIGKNIDFMVDKINKSSFIFIDKKDDRFSGSISLALSHNIPMIIDKYQKEKYKFPAITFENSILEITDKLNNISDDEYSNLIEKQTEFSNKILISYPEKLKSILN